MKKSLLLFLLLPCAVAVQAQKNVLVSDSAFTSDDSDSYSLSSASQYYYNSQCQDSATQTTNIDPFFGDSSNSQNVYDYYPDGSVYHEISKVPDNNGVFVNSTRITYTYTAAKKPASILIEDWNASSSTWVPLSEEIYVYNAGGFLTSDTSKTQSNNPGMLGVSSYATYYNNSSGFADSSVRIYPGSSTTTKSYFTYSSSNRIQQTLIYNYKNTTVTSAVRFTYSHDSTNNVTTDSITTEVMQSSGNFALNNTSVTQNIYNVDGTLSQSFVTSNIYFTPTPVTSYTKTNYHYAPCTSLVLPVSLLSFSAAQKGNDALLQWKTASETNTAYFSVQRSTDGINFINISKVVASGNSTVQKNYSFTDANMNVLTTAKVYYRLAERDNDGSIMYSKIEGLTISSGKLSVSISPNPVRNIIVLYSPVSLANALVKITDMNGIVLYTSRQNIAADSKLIIDASQFAKGIYLVTVQSQTGQQVLKIMK